MPVFVQSSNIISPLGRTTEENFSAVVAGKSGVRRIDDNGIAMNAVQASLMTEVERIDGFTKLESLIIQSIEDCLNNAKEKLDPEKCLFVLSTTKGNIDALAKDSGIPESAYLATLNSKIATQFKLAENGILVSNACISGVAAISMAARMIESGRYKQAIVCGADILSEFVVSGFNSLMAISPELCKPYDADRKGINIGEGCGSVFLSTNYSDVEVLGGFTSNDANHISGPSRTGDGLHNSIERTLKHWDIRAQEIDLINAHGTATSFNDEMESKAFKLAELEAKPINSLKAYFGHTLGAAGMIESIITFEAMKKNIQIQSKGFDKPGTSVPLNVIEKTKELQQNIILKTASGFGGCNAAILFKKSVGVQ